MYHNGMEPLVDNNQYDTWEILLSLNIGKKNEEIAELYYLDGKRVMECAKLLGITSQGVVVRLRQVKRQIRDRMARLKAWKYRQDVLTGFNDRLYNVARLYFSELYTRREIAWILGVGVASVYKSLSALGAKILIEDFIDNKGILDD